MIKKYFAMTIIAASVSLAACSDDDDDEMPAPEQPGTEMPGTEMPEPEPPVMLPDVTEGGGSVYDTIAASTDHTTLLAAINSVPDLDKTLDNPASTFTVFAPTNAAFDALLAASEDDAFTETADFLTPENQAVLVRVLQGHVIPSLVPSTVVATLAESGTATATLATGADLTFAPTTTEPAAASGFDLIGAAEGAAPIPLNLVDLGENLEAGVVHSIDSVITVPPAPETPEPENPEPETPDPVDPGSVTGTANTALATAGTSEIFRNAIDRDFVGSFDTQPWTFFVPSDAVLQAAGVTDLTVPQLQTHIVTTANAPDALGALESILTSNNASFDVATDEAGNITVGGNAVSLIAVGDSGGQIYSIDGILSAE